MSLPTQTPPLLLTKRLTTFLQANTSPQLPTLLLTTSHGKLLAHASPLPVALLRTHATVAASLLAIHASSSTALPAALPGSRSSEDRAAAASPTPAADDPAQPDEPHPPTRSRSIKPATITVQLSGGTVVVRRLRCGLLFVCVGPAADQPQPQQPQQQPVPSSSPPRDPHDAQNQPSNGADGSSSSSSGLLHPGPNPHGGGLLGVPASPSDAGSLASAGAQTTSSLDGVAAAAVVAMRRQAAELARWLDDKLGTLKVPEQSVGAE